MNSTFLKRQVMFEYSSESGRMVQKVVISPYNKPKTESSSKSIEPLTFDPTDKRIKRARFIGQDMFGDIVDVVAYIIDRDLEDKVSDMTEISPIEGRKWLKVPFDILVDHNTQPTLNEYVPKSKDKMVRFRGRTNGGQIITVKGRITKYRGRTADVYELQPSKGRTWKKVRYSVMKAPNHKPPEPPDGVWPIGAEAKKKYARLR